MIVLRLVVYCRTLFSAGAIKNGNLDTAFVVYRFDGPAVQNALVRHHFDLRI